MVSHIWHIASYTLIGVLFLCMYYPTNTTADPSENSQNWLNHGGNLKNRRYADKETKINPITASKLKLKWEFYAGKDITATPAIFNGILYFPSWNGNIYAVKALDGSLVWKKNVYELTGIDSPRIVLGTNVTVSRSTPTIAENLLIVGIYAPCVVIALERSTGKLVWMTLLDKHPAGVVTMSGTYYKGSIYVGTSSLEEQATIEQCCTFIGSLAKLDVQTGRIIWQAYMLPSNQGKRGGYAGAAIWGSSPSIDTNRNLIYIATGNLYSAPKNVTECQERQNNQASPTQPDECIEPDNHSNSMLALELDTGKIRWYRQLGGYDVWFVACNNLSTPNCPPGPNPDADFGEVPMMLSVFNNGRMKDIVVAVQKSGFAWALDRDYGSLIWSTEAGPGGLAGGGTWGAATDEKRVYTNLVNSNAKNFTLKPSNRITNSGGWVAMDARSGRILWSTADPNNATTNGPVTVANGVVFASSMFREGPIYAMNAITGKILWSYKTGATVYGGMSVSNGCAYVGNGYNVSLGFSNPSVKGGTSLYAFCVY